ncbi:dihydrofolate reductase [Streptomyces camponoticapitis]|uniref:Dihydrofolate reductase n=1 Tax=Streptomyces camponoticapitis TaxID=1616125 RepID=A0ABQ2EF29_9ACTN|nr:dihydrofolate reductase family protein [Streptomyces camponoticapitis]GGK05201.1 dihydrofolate reductase [Streptomyces camponoticapitis]
MRDSLITENITVDGVIDAAGGWFAPAEGTEDQSDINEELRRQMTAADAFLVGRVTFEEMRGYWPRRTDDTTGVGDYLNSVSQYVISRTLGDPGWEHTTVLRGDVRAEVRELKAGAGGDIVTTGSVRLARELVAAGLVDEYRLFVYPVVLGHGRRLFAGAGAADVPGLRLVQSLPFTSGVVLLRYRTV